VDQEHFTAVDAHLDEVFGTPDAALRDALARSEEAGLPPIGVSASTGRFLQVLVAARGARRVLEIGTLGGYSTIWLARALPEDGRLITLEHDPHHAEVARTNLDAAGVGDRVEIVVGDALASLARMQDEGTEPFDLTFIDADKAPYADYLEAAVRLSSPRAVIVADNVVRGGAITSGGSDDAAVAGVQRFNAALAAHPQLQACAVLQIVGEKGHDGLGFGVVAG